MLKCHQLVVQKHLPLSFGPFRALSLTQPNERVQVRKTFLHHSGSVTVGNPVCCWKPVKITREGAHVVHVFDLAFIPLASQSETVSLCHQLGPAHNIMFFSYKSCTFHTHHICKEKCSFSHKHYLEAYI